VSVRVPRPEKMQKKIESKIGTFIKSTMVNSPKHTGCNSNALNSPKETSEKDENEKDIG
jgi:hypothetical protein